MFLAVKLLLNIILLYYSAEGQTEGPSHPLTISDLYVRLKSPAEEKLLSQEFFTIPMAPRKPMEIGSLPQNIKKNRKLDSLPYDETRVVLDSTLGDPYSDYINANYIDGYNRQFEYVATQAPLPNTFNDFWKMVWQLNSRKIVMMTKLVENGTVSADKYWPDTTELYGQIVITKADEIKVGDDIIIRTFILRKAGCSESRTVIQYQYLGWPDGGVPSLPSSVYKLLQQVRNEDNDLVDVAPLIVHDSGGIGRCSCYILIDSEIERAQIEGLIDFPKRVNHMRDQRQKLVYTEEQYLFAYKVLSYYFFKTEDENK